MRTHDRTGLTVLQKSLLLGILVIMLVTLIPPPGYAEELDTRSNQASIPELELIKEEETVSIASRYEQPISKAPSNVYVITDEDIRQSGATDLPTVLRRVPGVEVMQMTGADINVSMRGDNQLQTNKLLVMVDGRSIFSDGQGQVFWKMLPVTLPEIKRIEVMKGPGSVIYGFNAFDGVINIITKSPKEIAGTTVQFGGGEFGTISSAAIHAGSAGNLGYRLSLGHDQNQQWRNRNALAFRSDKLNAQTEYPLSGGAKLLLSGGAVNANRFEGALNESSLAESRNSQAYTHMGYERPDLYLRGFWMQTHQNIEQLPHPLLGNLFLGTDPDGNHPLLYTTNTYNIDGLHTLTVLDSWRISYGVNYRYNTLTGNAVSPSAHENRLGVLMQSVWTPIELLSVTAGVRYDMDSFINPTVSPRFAVVLTPVPDHTFRASFSVGYRPPTLLETFGNARFPTPFNPPGTPPLKYLGNPNTIPEQIVSYDIGYQGWYVQHRVRVRADLFANLIRDIQDPRFDNASRTVFYDNRPGKAKIYGGEFGLELLITSWLQGFGNVSFVKVDDMFGGNVQREAPRVKYNAGLRAEFDNGVSGDAAVSYVDHTSYRIDSDFRAAPLFGNATPSRLIDSYTLVSFRAAYRFWQEQSTTGHPREAEVAVSAFNALNDKHKEHPLGDTIGSRVMGWLTVRY